MQIAEALSDKGDALVLTKPEMRFEYSPELALHEAYRILATGDRTVRPIDDVASTNEEWEQTVFRMMRVIQWAQDYNSLNPEDKERLRRTSEEAPTE